MTAGAAAAAAAAAIEAIKASGVVVRVRPGEFQALLDRIAGALVVQATSGVFSTKYKYLVSYRGLAFYTESRDALTMPADAEVVRAGKIWVPG